MSEYIRRFYPTKSDLVEIPDGTFAKATSAELNEFIRCHEVKSAEAASDDIVSHP